MAVQMIINGSLQLHEEIFMVNPKYDLNFCPVLASAILQFPLR